MPVQMVRNNQAGPTVLSPDDNAKRYIEWQGKGDPNGGDIQPVGEDVQENTQFQKMLRRGVLELVSEDDESVGEAMGRQQAHWDQRQGQSSATAEQAIDHQANKDLVTLGCVGPSTRGDSTSKCGADVTVRDTEKDKRPPLCNVHQDLAPQFVPEDTILDGKPTKVWTRFTMGARERAQ